MKITCSKPVRTYMIVFPDVYVTEFADGTSITFKRGQGIEPVFSKYFIRRLLPLSPA